MSEANDLSALLYPVLREALLSIQPEKFIELLNTYFVEAVVLFNRQYSGNILGVVKKAFLGDSVFGNRLQVIVQKICCIFIVDWVCVLIVPATIFCGE